MIGWKTENRKRLKGDKITFELNKSFFPLNKKHLKAISPVRRASVSNLTVTPLPPLDAEKVKKHFQYIKERNSGSVSKSARHNSEYDPCLEMPEKRRDLPLPVPTSPRPEPPVALKLKPLVQPIRDISTVGNPEPPNLFERVLQLELAEQKSQSHKPTPGSNIDETSILFERYRNIVA